MLVYRILIPLGLVALVVLPLLLATPTVEDVADASADGESGGVQRLIIISPHNELIRTEFGRAFNHWHQQHYGRPVDVQWRSIGDDESTSAPFPASVSAFFLRAHFDAAAEGGEAS